VKNADSHIKLIAGIKNMIKLQHTPGPWQIGTPPPNGEQTIGLNNGLMIAISTTGDNIDSKANARLIAAAPEMLEALIMVKKYGHSGYVEGSKTDIEFWFKIDKTIEKATGMSIEEILK
jgi:hypothetical protein